MGSVQWMGHLLADHTPPLAPVRGDGIFVEKYVVTTIETALPTA
jgi:hypothetical protein